MTSPDPNKRKLLNRKVVVNSTSLYPSVAHALAKVKYVARWFPAGLRLHPGAAGAAIPPSTSKYPLG